MSTSSSFDDNNNKKKQAIVDDSITLQLNSSSDRSYSCYGGTECTVSPFRFNLNGDENECKGDLLQKKCSPFELNLNCGDLNSKGGDLLEKLCSTTSSPFGLCLNSGSSFVEKKCPVLNDGVLMLEKKCSGASPFGLSLNGGDSFLEKKCSLPDNDGVFMLKKKCLSASDLSGDHLVDKKCSMGVGLTGDLILTDATACLNSDLLEKKYFSEPDLSGIQMSEEKCSLSYSASAGDHLLEKFDGVNRIIVGKKEEGIGEKRGKVETWEEVEEEEEDEFKLLGQPMCMKRKRNVEAVSSCSSSSSSTKRAVKDNGLGLQMRKAAVRAWSNQPLSIADPDVHEIMEKEKERQCKGIELIASENFVCRAVMEALGSHLTNKYSEGMPGARYYCGNQYIDEIELLCWKRALQAFHLDEEKWAVNVQPYSCTSANFAVYTALLHPGDRIMGLDTPSGGHLSHGCCTPSGKKVSGASIFFETLPYKVNPKTGYIDFEKLEERANDFRPKILICGGSSYPREWDYARFRKIADKCGSVLLCDMAHISGLVAAKELASPFDYCDIVTSTTHKSLRGPRGGIIFYRKGLKPRKRSTSQNQGGCNDQYDFEEKINFAVHPSLQGGPHNNHIAALAIALKQVATPDYTAYMQQVKKNAQALASALLRRNCTLVTGGTDNHLVLWDLRNLGLIGKNFEKVCEACNITLNKCAIFGDNGAISSGGVRIGTPAMTSRGCLEADFVTMVDFLLKAAQITCIVQREHGKLLNDVFKVLHVRKDIVELRNRVENFASQFAMPGFDI